MDTQNSLIEAVLKCDKTEVKRLLAQGYDPNIPSKTYTALQWAVAMAESEIVSDLLSYGADATVIDGAQNNLLHIAVAQANQGIKRSHSTIEALLSYNISRTDKNICGKTPLEKANEETRKIISEFDNRPKNMLVFLQAQHQRLGSKSPANQLSTDTAQIIFSFLRPDKYHTR